jgi:hypothetical protein
MAYALKSRFLLRSRSRLSISTLLKVDLDVKDNLDRFQKLILTRWTFSISISIGLDCRDPQGYIIWIKKVGIDILAGQKLSNINTCMLKYVSIFKSGYLKSFPEPFQKSRTQSYKTDYANAKILELA